ncbi:MAG: NAD(P)/FAD-dependent oxidoreductase [Pseudomonadota bacterium]
MGLDGAYSAVISGAGPAGVSLALFLARRGHRIALLDPGSVSQGEAEPRGRALPHRLQGHSFLALGTGILDRELPDVVAALLQGGGTRAPLPHEPQHWNLLSSRRLLDEILVGTARAQQGIDFIEDAAARDLLFEGRRAGAAPHVIGLRTDRGDLRARYVVDATGRRSPFRGWLRSRGVELAGENHASRHIYLTRHYRLRPGRCFPPFRVPVVAALPYATVLAFPEDNGHFQISIQLHGSDPVRRALHEADRFDGFLSEVPVVAPWLEAGEPVSEPLPCASVGNRRVSLWRAAPLVTGLLLVGDAAAHTNPTAGRGVSLALAHARRIALLLDTAIDDKSPSEVCREWEELTADVIGPWLTSQIRIDQEREQEVLASIEGRAHAVSSDSSRRVAVAMAALHDCPVVGPAADRLLNMLALPDEVFSDQDVMRRVFRQLRNSDIGTRRMGPNRDEFEAMMREYRHAV